VNEVQKKRIIKAHYSGSNKKVVGEDVTRYWTVDDEDPTVKELIANGKIKFAFSQRFEVEGDGQRTVRYRH
jgi:hypothetical protein